jgi:hypothetical protein
MSTLYPDTLRYIASFVGDLTFSTTCKQWQDALRLSRIKETGGLDTVYVNNNNNNNQYSLVGPRTRHLHASFVLSQLTYYNLISLSMKGCIWITKLPKLPPTLQRLTLQYFPDIEVIPTLPPSLQQLTLQYFPRVRELPELPPTLQQLTLQDFPLVEVIPELPPTLQQMTLCNFPLVKVIPVSSTIDAPRFSTG